MPTNCPPGVRRAISLIKSAIESGVFRTGEPLPERNALAHMAQVSARTVSSAISVLKREGVLDGVRGQRAFVSTIQANRLADALDAPDALAGRSAAKDSTRPSYSSVISQLRGDILDGRYAPGERLPGRKTLQNHYGSSHSPLRKALGLLVNQGLLRRHGRGLVVPVASVSPSKNRIALLTYNEQGFLPSYSRDKTFISAVEIQCHKSNVGLENLIVCEKNGRVLLRRSDIDTPVDPRCVTGCMGIIYLVSWGGCTNPIVLDWLAHLGKPVSIHDWIGAWTPPRDLASSKLVQWVCGVSSAAAGFHVGRFLRGLGHHHIAFFAPLEEPYSMARLRGLREVYASIDGTSSVSEFIRAPVSNDINFHDMVNKRYRKFRPVDSCPPGIPKAYEIGSTDFGRKTWDIYENAARYELLEPLFEQALARPEITAWVGSEDAISLMMWSFLQTKGVGIPGDMSVVGFSNGFEALEHDLTSYDFDFPAMTSIALNFLLRPILARGIKALTTPRIEGFVIERGSTARA